MVFRYLTFVLLLRLKKAYETQQREKEYYRREYEMLRRENENLQREKENIQSELHAR